MDIEQEREAIETQFRNCWLVRKPDTYQTPYSLDAETFEPPTDESSVVLTILDGDSINASVGAPGSNTVRYAGVVAIQVFVVGGRNDSEASAEMRRVINLLKPIFTNWKNKTLQFRTMGMADRLEMQPHLMQTVNFPFQRDEFHG